MDSDLEGGPPTTQAEFLMQKLGYYKDPDDLGVQHGVADLHAPKSFPPELLSMSGGARKQDVAIQIPDLPGDIQELVDELNGCLDHGYKNASALLIRKIIHQAVFIAMARRGKANLLKTKTGEDVGLRHGDRQGQHRSTA